MLSSQPVPCKCADCRTLAPLPILPPAQRGSAGHKHLEPRRTNYDMQPGLQMTVNNELDDATCAAMSCELSILQKKLTIKKPQWNIAARQLDTRPRPVFRFLDLPAEVRLRVYEYTVNKDFVLRLRCPPLPSVCRSSRILRHESLPIFFANNYFVAEVRTNFHGLSNCSTAGDVAHYIDEKDRRYKQLGSLDLGLNMTRLLAMSHPRHIVIRNIDICMLPPTFRGREDRQYRYAILSLRHRRTCKVSVHLKDGPNQVYTGHLRRLLENAKQVLNESLIKSASTGLYMVQLREVAAAFRAENPLEKGSATSPVSVAAATNGAEEFDLTDAESYFPADVCTLQTQKDSAPGPHTNGRWLAPMPAEDIFELPEAESYFNT